MLLETTYESESQQRTGLHSDEIRNTLTALGFEIKDTKDGFEWRLNK